MTQASEYQPVNTAVSFSGAEPQPFTFHVHYKDPTKTYLVLSCATNKTTDVREVVYLCLYDVPADQRLWTRDVTEWNEHVIIANHDRIPRFCQVEPNVEARRVAAHLLLDMTHEVLA